MNAQAATPAQAFQFTAKQIDAIRAPLAKRFGLADVDKFIAVAEHEIDEWRGVWPGLDAKQLRPSRHHLGQLAKHLDGLRHELAALHPYVKAPLWRELGGSTPGEWRRKGAEFENAVTVMRMAVRRDMDSSKESNGRHNVSKRELVERLAWAYYGALGALPTVTPDGQFMEAVSAIADAIGEQIGKHTIAKALKAWRAEREFHFTG